MKALTAFLVVMGVVLASGLGGPTVGIEGRIDVTLPGPELKAKPADRLAPLNLRIAATRPHGTQIHYDLRYIGFVPGQYDLRAWLLQPDGSAPDELPPIPVEIGGVLPTEHHGQLVALEREPMRRFVRYRWLILGAVAVWVLLAIPLFRSRRRAGASAAPTVAAPPTLAEQLRPLVERASHGQLSTDDQAKLERLLLKHWRQRLDLESLDAHEAVSRLREHPEAGALLRALEDWLHRRPGTAKVDVEAVLAPYAGVAVSEEIGLSATNPR